MNKRKILTNNFTIESTINIEYSPLYENLNVLNNKIATDKELQQKIKDILKNNSSIYPKKSLIKTSPEKNYQSDNDKVHTLKNNSVKFTLTAVNQKNSKLERNNSFINQRSGTFKKLSKKAINRSLSSHSKIKAKQKYFNFPQQKLISKKKFSSKKCSLCSGDNIIKSCKLRTNTIVLTPQKSGKKKITNLLSQINFNIEKTNENLNHPDEFYSNYFQTLLGTEKTKEKKSKRRTSCFVVRSSKIETLKNKKERKQKAV